jgi:hypothetical protein
VNRYCKGTFRSQSRIGDFQQNGDSVLMWIGSGSPTGDKFRSSPIVRKIVRHVSVLLGFLVRLSALVLAQVFTRIWQCKRGINE